MNNDFFHFQIQSARVDTFVLGVFLAMQPLIVAMVSDALLPFGKTVGLGNGGIVGLKILAHWQMKRPVLIDELPTSDFKRRLSDDVSSC
jgi:hypothetical protein